MNRYTTLIDITGLPLYRSVGARLLYVHLCLKSGYHMDDLDICRESLAQLSYNTGMTISATRHALSLLTTAGLVIREGSALKVVKFVQPVLAAKRSAASRQDGTDEEDKRQRRIQFLQEELEKLRRWWHDAHERGDNEACKGISADAAKLKRELTQLQGV